tara:strand:+ start:44 stop:208 length:165 start_codon:yes stop_codon:yes gene_type:complete
MVLAKRRHQTFKVRMHAGHGQPGNIFLGIVKLNDRDCPLLLFFFNFCLILAAAH